MGEMNDGNVSEMGLLEFREYCKSVNVSEMDAHEFAMYCKRWNERYVVDTLEASIWCLLNTNSYKECVLKAVNLGNDTDTVGSVVGGLAGIYYGSDDIPEEWLDVLVRRQYIEELCEKLQKIG